MKKSKYQQCFQWFIVYILVPYAFPYAFPLASYELQRLLEGKHLLEGTRGCSTY